MTPKNAFYALYALVVLLALASYSASAVTNETLISFYNFTNQTMSSWTGSFGATDSSTANSTGIYLDGREATANSQRIDISGTVLSTTSSYTINFWMRMNDTGNIIPMGKASAWNFGSVTSANTQQIAFFSGGWNVLCSAATQQNVNWTMVTMTYNSSSTVATGFWNGTSCGSFTGAGVFNTNTISLFHISGEPAADTLIGRLDAVGFWNRTLVPWEVFDLYNNTLGNNSIFEPPFTVTTVTPTAYTLNLSVNATVTRVSQNATFFFTVNVSCAGNSTTNCSSTVTLDPLLEQLRPRPMPMCATREEVE